MTSLELNYLSKTLSPNTVKFYGTGIGTLTFEFGARGTQHITTVYILPLLREI